MRLTQVQQQRVAQFVVRFRQYLESGDQGFDLEERQKRVSAYAQLLSPAGLDQMTELEFGQAISSLWASQIWGNKGYLVDKLIRDNGLPTLVTQLRQLLWGHGTIASRYDAFRKAIKGLGPASITELLAFVHPDECGLWNEKARKALQVLGFEETFPALHKYHITGTQYQQFNELLAAIRDELGRQSIASLDLLGVDYFLFEVWKSGELLEPEPEVRPAPNYDFDHDEVVDQLVTVGLWLGFQAEKEKTVAKGAKVDVIWQARIANLGVVTYVFEVQRKGSIDSLILNLQKTQNNPTVQRLIVVANTQELGKVRQEIAALPESFRKAVGFMEAAEIMRAAVLQTELADIINRLELVQSEFGK